MANIVLKTYAAGENNQGSVTPQNDALIYQSAIPMNGIFSGAVITLSSANVLHVAAGMGIIGGRFFEVLESDIPVQLSVSGDLLGRLYIHLDLSNADNPIEINAVTDASLPALQGDPDLNISNGVFDMELCTFDINELTISNIVQTFPTITAANNQIRRATAYSVNDFVLCQSASDALIFVCTTAGTTAVQEPTAYQTVTDGNTVTDGTAVFKAVSVAGQITKLSKTEDLASNAQQMIAPIETNASSASQGYAIGKQFILNGLLSVATAAITQGEAFVLNGNYKLADSITQQIEDSGWQQLNSYISYRKVGKQVFVYTSIPSSVISQGAWADFGSLPAGYRPAFGFYHCIFSSSANMGFQNLTLTSSGLIQAMGNASVSGMVTFLIN